MSVSFVEMLMILCRSRIVLCMPHVLNVTAFIRRVSICLMLSVLVYLGVGCLVCGVCRSLCVVVFMRGLYEGHWFSVSCCSLFMFVVLFRWDIVHGVE